jgi:hypothetical protein
VRLLATIAFLGFGVGLGLGLGACGDQARLEPDASAVPDAPADAAAPDAPGAFGELGGMCGVLGAADLTGPSPRFVRATFTFARRFDDPADRPLLTPGGRHVIETPNAGGSSIFSEVFAYEQLARCELAPLVKTETEIVYDTAGKITDLSVSIQGVKIGVSVTRAFAFPLGTPYSVSQATTLIKRKLEDILVSTADVSAADRWQKQILAVLAYDDQAADTVLEAWNGLAPAVKADSIVLVTTTHGADTFIYTNQ